MDGSLTTATVTDFQKLLGIIFCYQSSAMENFINRFSILKHTTENYVQIGSSLVQKQNLKNHRA